MAIQVSTTTVIDNSRNFIARSYRADIVANGTGVSIDCSTGCYFTVTVSSSQTFAFTNVPASTAFGIIIEVNHTGGTISWPAAVVWPENTAPTLTTGKTHLFVLITDDGGTKWRAGSLVNYTT